MTWLVTGGSGFLGGHVLRALADCPYRVIALGRHHPGGWPVDQFVRADLDDSEALTQAISRISPDVVIHTAGKTPPALSSSLYLANTRATMHLLDALRALDKSCHVIVAGSAAELGAVPADHLPVNEEEPCRPTDAYGLSKWAVTKLAMQMEPPLKVSVARLFNPIGPGMPTSQAFGRFAAILAASGSSPTTLTVGDLSTKRDFLDVRDAAEALISLAEMNASGQVFHVGTGVSRSVADGLNELIRLSRRDVRIETSPSRRGPSDSRADIRRIVSETGWSPRISWSQSLADLWDDARRRIEPRRVA